MALKDTPFWLFNWAYLAFLARTIYFLLLALGGDGTESPVTVLPLVPDPLFLLLSTAGFVVFMGALYVALRIALGSLHWKLGLKTQVQHRDDFVRMSYLNVALVVLARVSGRFAAGGDGGAFGSSADALSFLWLVCFYTAFFSLLFEMVRYVNLHIGPDLVHNLRGLWIFVVGGSVVLGVLWAHVRFAFQQDATFGRAYVGWVILCLLVQAVVHTVPLYLAKDQKTSRAKLHVHHWYWAFFAAHFSVFDDRLSCEAQAIFLAIYIHGTACFGLEAIFEPR